MTNIPFLVNYVKDQQRRIEDGSGCYDAESILKYVAYCLGDEMKK